MRTEDLIALLSVDAPRRRWRPGPAVLCAAVAGALVSLAIVVALIGVRPDMPGAIADPRVLFKFLFGGVFAITGLVAAGRLVRPEARPRAALILVPGAVLLVAGVVGELLLTPQTHWARAAVGIGPFGCVAFIIVLSVMPVVAVMSVLRAGAPASPAGAGAAAGLLGGAIGSAIFALNCPNDSALFVAIWYLAAVVATTAIGAVTGRRLLAW